MNRFQEDRIVAIDVSFKVMKILVSREAANQDLFPKARKEMIRIILTR